MDAVRNGHLPVARLLIEKHQVDLSVEGIYTNIYFDSAVVESAGCFSSPVHCSPVPDVSTSRAHPHVFHV